MSKNITLRPVTAADEPFLYRVYASTREEELAQVNWTADQKLAFLQMQFAAQDTYYHENYTGASYDIIVVDGQAAGRLYVARWPAEIRIMDIALLPNYRNGGTGSTLLKQLLAEGEMAGKPVSIHVERFNPALRLYERLGFRNIADKGVYYLMQRVPSVASDRL